LDFKISTHNARHALLGKNVRLVAPTGVDLRLFMRVWDGLSS